MADLRQPQINLLIISGRMAGDPEVKTIPRRQSEDREPMIVCNVSIATDDGWGDKKKPIFLDCTFWGKSAEFAGKLKKGSPVVLEGRIRMDEWEDKNTGAKRSKIGMTVSRVHALAWETVKSTKADADGGLPY